MSIIQFLEREEQQTGQVWDYVSPSRLSLWLKCPLAFKRRYIDEWKTALTPALFVGKVVHSVLAHIYRLRIAGHVATMDELPTFVADAWEYARETEPCYFDDDSDEQKYKHQVLDLATTYLPQHDTNTEREAGSDREEVRSTTH